MSFCWNLTKSAEVDIATFKVQQCSGATLKEQKILKSPIFDAVKALADPRVCI